MHSLVNMLDNHDMIYKITDSTLFVKQAKNTYYSLYYTM